MRTNSMSRIEPPRTRKTQESRIQSFHPQVETLECRRLLAFSSEFASGFYVDEAHVAAEVALEIDQNSHGVSLGIAAHSQEFQTSKLNNLNVQSSDHDSAVVDSVFADSTSVDSQLPTTPWLILFQSIQRDSSYSTHEQASENSRSLASFTASIVNYFSSQRSVVNSDPFNSDGAKPKRQLIDDETPEGLPNDAIAVESPSRPERNVGQPAVSNSPQNSGGGITQDDSLSVGPINSSVSILRIAGRLDPTKEEAVNAVENQSNEYSGLIVIDRFTRSRSELRVDPAESSFMTEERFDAADDRSNEDVDDDLIAADDWQHSRPKQPTNEKPENARDDYRHHERYQRRQRINSKADKTQVTESNDSADNKLEFGGMITIRSESNWSENEIMFDRSVAPAGFREAAIFSEVGNAQAFGFLDAIEADNGNTEILDGDDASLTEHDVESSELSSAALLVPFFWQGYRKQQKRKVRNGRRPSLKIELR